MKTDLNSCILLCFGKTILQPHLKHPLFWELLFPPPCHDFLCLGMGFGLYGDKQCVILTSVQNLQEMELLDYFWSRFCLVSI